MLTFRKMREGSSIPKPEITSCWDIEKKPRHNPIEEKVIHSRDVKFNGMEKIEATRFGIILLRSSTTTEIESLEHNDLWDLVELLTG